MLKGKKIAILGGGNMGEVIAAGLVKSELVAPEALVVTDVSEARRAYLQGKHPFRTSDDNHEAVRFADISVIAVKPQNIQELLEDIRPHLEPGRLLVSIAAGIPIRFIEAHLGEGKHPIVRVMPNTPALIGEGATALAGGPHATEKDVQTAKRIFDDLGTTVVVREELLDAVTGLSGSGPAYAFIMIEALSDGGVKMGLPRDVATRLAAQTLLGAAKLVLQGDRHPAQLKDMVTSPGGTTAAGIHALESGRLRATLISAVETATLRSRELGKLF